MKKEIKLDKYTLTTDHPASSYGLGILVDDDDGVYAPNDPLLLQDEMLCAVIGRPMLAGDIVAAWRGEATADERQLMRRYLSQDPEKKWD
jgi:hypothetical protein